MQCIKNISIDLYYHNTNYGWNESAPYRTITVKDALYDLPEIKCGSNIEEMSYVCEPITHFQRKVTIIGTHLCTCLETNALFDKI